MKDENKEDKINNIENLIAKKEDWSQVFSESSTKTGIISRFNRALINLVDSFDHGTFEEFSRKEAKFSQEIKKFKEEYITYAIFYCVENGKNRALIPLYKHLKSFPESKSGKKVKILFSRSIFPPSFFFVTNLLKIVIANDNYEALTTLVHYGYPINLSSLSKIGLSSLSDQEKERLHDAISDGMRINEFIKEKHDPSEFPDHIALLMVATLSEEGEYCPRMTF